MQFQLWELCWLKKGYSPPAPGVPTAPGSIVAAWMSLADPQVPLRHQVTSRHTRQPQWAFRACSRGLRPWAGAAGGSGVKECRENALQQYTTEEALQAEPREPGIQGCLLVTQEGVGTNTAYTAKKLIVKQELHGKI